VIFVALASSLGVATACASARAASPAVGVPPSSATAAEGFYSAAQVDRGRDAFRTNCVECHSINADFTGRAFEWNWRRRTVWDLFRRIKETMPEDFPGLLTDQGYADIIAYILDANGYAAGAGDLMPTDVSMSVIPLGPGARKTRGMDGTRS